MAANQQLVAHQCTNILRIVPAPVVAASTLDLDGTIQSSDSPIVPPTTAVTPKSGAGGLGKQKQRAVEASVIGNHQDSSYTLPLVIKDGGKTVQLEVAPSTPAVVSNKGAGIRGLPPSSTGTKMAEDLLRNSVRGSFATDPRRDQKDRDARRGANRSAIDGDMGFDHAYDIDVCSEAIAAQMKTIIVPQVAQRRNVVAIFTGYKDTQTSATLEAVLHTAMESLKGTVVSVAEAQNEALSMSAELPPSRREVAALALSRMNAQGIATASPTGRREPGGGGSFTSPLAVNDGGEVMDISHVTPGRGGGNHLSDSVLNSKGNAVSPATALKARNNSSNHQPSPTKARGGRSPSSRGAGARSPSPNRLRANSAAMTVSRPGTNMSQYTNNTTVSPGSYSKYSLLMARLPRDQSQIEVSEVSQLVSRPLLPNLLDKSYEYSLRGGRPKKNSIKKMKKVKKTVQIEVPAPDGGTMTVDDDIEVEVTDEDAVSDEEGGDGTVGTYHSTPTSKGKAAVSKVRARYLEFRKPLGYPTFEAPFSRGRPSQATTSIPGGLRQGISRSLTFGPKHYVTCPYPDSIDAAMKANFGMTVSFWVCTGDGAGGPPPLPTFDGLANSMTIGGCDTLSSGGFDMGSMSGVTSMAHRQMTAFHFMDAHEPNFMVRALLNTNDVGTYEKGFSLVTVRDAHGRYLEVVFAGNPCDGHWHFIDLNISPKEKAITMSIDGKPARGRVTSPEQPTAFDGGRKKTVLLGASPGEKENEGMHVLAGTILDFQVSRQGVSLLHYPLMEKGLVCLNDKASCHTPKPRVAEVVNLPPNMDVSDIPTHDYKFPRTAPYFDGRGAHVNVGSLGDYAFFENGSTIEFTMKTTSIAEPMTLIGVVDSKGHHPGFGVDLNTNSHGSFQRYSVCVWVVDYSGNVIRCVADLSEAFDDRWHTVSIRLTDMFSGKFKFRLDNRPVESSTAATQTPPSQFVRYEDYVTIGCLNDRGRTQSRFFKGSLKSLRLSKHRDTPTGSEVLVFADWGFVEGPRSPLIFDQSGNGHNGVLVAGSGYKEFPWFVVSGDEEVDAEDDLTDQRMTVNRHDNNAVAVAVVAIVTRVDAKSGRCYEVVEDLVNNITIRDLETVPLAGFNPRVRRDDPRCFRGIPEKCFKPVTPVDYQQTIRKALRNAYGEHSSYALPQDQEAAAAAKQAAAEAAPSGGEGRDVAAASMMAESHMRRDSNARSGLSDYEQLRSHKVVVLRLGDAMFTCIDLASYTKTDKAKLLVTPNQISWTDVHCTSGVANKINNSINHALTSVDKMLLSVGHHPQLYKRTTLLNPATPTQYDNTIANIIAANMMASAEYCTLHYFQHLHSRSTRDEALYSLLISNGMIAADAEHAGMMIQKIARSRSAKHIFHDKSQRKFEADARVERAKLLRKQYPGDVAEKRKKIALVVSCMDFPYDKRMPNDFNRYQFNDVKTITRLFEGLKFTTVEVLMDPSLSSFKNALVEKKAQQKKEDAQLVVYYMGTGMIDCYDLPPTVHQQRLYLEEEELDSRRNEVMAEQQRDWLSLYEDHWFGMQSLYDSEFAAYEDLVLNMSKKKKKKPAKGAVATGPMPPKALPTPYDMWELLAEFSSWRTKIAPNVGQPINPARMTSNSDGSLQAQQTMTIPFSSTMDNSVPDDKLPVESTFIFEKLLRNFRRQNFIPESDIGLSGKPVVEQIIEDQSAPSQAAFSISAPTSPAVQIGSNLNPWGDHLSDASQDEDEESDFEDGEHGVLGKNPSVALSNEGGFNSTQQHNAEGAVSNTSRKPSVVAQSPSVVLPPPSPTKRTRKPKMKVITKYNRQQYLCLADTSVPIAAENTITLDEVKRLVIGDRFGVRGNHSILIYDCVSIPSKTQRKTSKGSPYGGFGGMVAATGETIHVDYRRRQILLLTYYIKKTLIGAAVECVRVGRHDPPSVVTVDTTFQYLMKKFDPIHGKCPARQVTSSLFGEYIGDCYVAPFLLSTKNERRQQKTALAGKKNIVRLLFRWNGVLGAEFKTILQQDIAKVCRSASANQCELKRVQVLDQVIVTLKAANPLTIETLEQPQESESNDGDEDPSGARRRQSSVKKRLLGAGGASAASAPPKSFTALPSLRCAVDYNTLVHNSVAQSRLVSDLENLFSASTSKLRCPKFTYRICTGHPPSIVMTFLDLSQYEKKSTNEDDDDTNSASKLSGTDALRERARIFAQRQDAKTADTDAFVLGAIGMLSRSNTRLAGLVPVTVTSYIEAYISLNEDDTQRLERAARRGSIMAHGDAVLVSVAQLDDNQLNDYDLFDNLMQLDETRRNQDGKLKLAKETDVRKKAEDVRKKLKDMTSNVTTTLSQIKTANKFTAEDVELCFSIPLPDVLATVLETFSGVCSKATISQFTSKEIGLFAKLETIVRTPLKFTPDEELQEAVLGVAHMVPRQLDARQLKHYKVVSGMWKLLSALAQCDVPLAETHPRIFPALITATFINFPAATISNVPFLKNVATAISAGGMSERNELLVPHGSIHSSTPTTMGSIMRPKYDYLDGDSAPNIAPEQFSAQFGTRHFRHIFSRSIAPSWPTLQVSGELKDEIEQLVVECVPCTVNDLLECIDPTYLPESEQEHMELGYEEQIRAEQVNTVRLQKFREAMGAAAGSAGSPGRVGSLTSQSSASSPQRRLSITAAEALGKAPVVSKIEKSAQQRLQRRREKLPPQSKFPRALVERELITRCKKMKVSVSVVSKLLQLVKDDLTISEMDPLSNSPDEDTEDSPTKKLKIYSRVNTPGKPRSMVLLASLIYTLANGTFDTVLSVHERVHEKTLEKYQTDVENYKVLLEEYNELVNGKGKRSRGSTAPPPNPPVAPVPPTIIAGTHHLPIVDQSLLHPHLEGSLDTSSQKEKFAAVLYVYAGVIEFLDSPTSPNVWDREMLNVCGPAIVFAGKPLEKLRRRLLRMYSNDISAVQLLGGAMSPEAHQETVMAQSVLGPPPPVTTKGGR